MLSMKAGLLGMFSLLFILCHSVSAEAQWYLPIDAPSRISLEGIKLTDIGVFGIVRKARKGIPAHLHTGIDIRRPYDNYADEPIFAAAAGVVISIRDDGPFAQIIIAHQGDGTGEIWTVYEHVAGITCTLGQTVDHTDVIARFFNRAELDRYGWQFDHVHFEIMKAPPVAAQPRKNLTDFRFQTYALTCYTEDDLEERMYDPRRFFREKFAENACAGGRSL